MINLARQAFTNPFLSVAGVSNQPGVSGSVARCPACGNTVGVESAIQPNIGLNPLGVGSNLGQQMGGFVPNPLAFSQPGLPINSLASQLFAGIPPTINPLSQLATNWPVATHHQGIGGRVGVTGFDPRFGYGAGGQQFGSTGANVPGSINPVAVDPISLLVSQQLNPLTQQQLPIRPLIGGPQGFGTQQQIPGFASPITQWTDPYRAFIEAQLISQLAANPFYQLQQRSYGYPETAGFGMPFNVGQQFNPQWANVPFYG
jgi:hypothetical protein